MKLIMPECDISDYKELRYLAYNIGLFRKNIPVELYAWIDKITTQYQEQRYESIQQAVEGKHTFQSLV